MEAGIKPIAKQYKIEHKKHGIWRRIVTVLAAIVVFCTTYALILPALTWENQLICELEEHQHTEDCYVFVDVPAGDHLVCRTKEHTHSEECYEERAVFICEEAKLPAHEHWAACYDAEGNLICTEAKPAAPIHEHSEACFDGDGNLICGLEEGSVHVHNENCYTENIVLVCDKEECEAHTHTEECYTEHLTQVCTTPEYEGHTHNDSCYVERTRLICTLEEGEEEETEEETEEAEEVEETEEAEETEEEGHIHGEACYDEEGSLICMQEEEQPQIPDYDSYDEEANLNSEPEEEQQQIPGEDRSDEEGNLISTQEEHHGHVHTAECYVTERVLVCTSEEREGHTHSEECYRAEKELTCTLPEGEGHQHGEECYIAVSVLTCPEGYGSAHVHTADCYEMQRFLICEEEAHIHDESCYQFMEAHQTPVLICDKTVHTHDASCFDAPPAYDDGYFCETAVHTHNESCYMEDGTLLCTLPEHTHSLMCQSNPKADLETPVDWEASVADAVLTGDKGADVLSVAETQVGYAESAENYLVVNDTELYGYNRYGAWFGYPYGDWNALFCGFCLHYAGVEDFPLFAASAPWMEALREEKLFFEPDFCIPKPGDLIFMEEAPSEEYDGIRNHVGIVRNVNCNESGIPVSVAVIEGNCSGCVAVYTLDAQSPSIAGYGKYREERKTQTVSVDGYTVTAEYGSDADIPNGAELQVRLIPFDTEEYWEYYRQSVDAMLDFGYAEEMEQLQLTFVQFFDISFLLNGESIEPNAAVNLVITADNAISANEGDTGSVVHFGNDGTEILPAETVIGEDNCSVEAFSFVQDSFSVSGLILSSSGGNESYRQKKVYSVSDLLNQEYALVCLATNNYKRMGAVQNYSPYGTNALVRMNLTADASGSSLVYGSDLSAWTFVNGAYTNTVKLKSGYKYVIMNEKGVTLTNDPNQATSFVVSFPSGDGSFQLSANGYVLNSSGSADTIIQWPDGDDFWVYQKNVPNNLNVWLDGTDGKLMNLLGSPDVNYKSYLVDNGNGTYALTLPTEWQSPPKQDYVLAGWYDIYGHTYYQPGDTAVIKKSTVFYADWRSKTYDVGVYDANHTVETLDTNEFITTYVFDYSPIFNVRSSNVTGSVDSGAHSETWTLLPLENTSNPGISDYSGKTTLGIIFRDWDTTGNCMTYPAGSSAGDINYVRTNVRSGIPQLIEQYTGEDITDILFDPESDSIGVSYVGKGNYLYNFNETTGYYYYDSYVNAASYNQSLERFYIYDYVERTSDSYKDEIIPATANTESGYTDFLPFNSPYMDNGGKTVVTYGREYNGKTNYQFDAKYDWEQSSAANAGTNYFFGFRTDIDFYLPNKTGFRDADGNVGNLSTHGDHMQFQFYGDDDIWVYVDGQFLLDIGGLHGVRAGYIDFSTGNIYVNASGHAKDGCQYIGHVDLPAGEHQLSMCFMERGSSQSNCRIFFNIGPRYDLEMKKSDAYDVLELLDGAEFAFYENEACTVPAELWYSEEDYKNGEPSRNRFRINEGYAYCWGLAPGHTYYIKEVVSPNVELYGTPDDTIKIILNSLGNATFVYAGENGEQSVGVIGYRVDEKTLSVDLSVTNRKVGTTCLTIKKNWSDGMTDHGPIWVCLRENGNIIGEPVQLTYSKTADQCYTFTWIGIPEPPKGTSFDAVYSVTEYPMSAYYYMSGSRITKDSQTGFYQCKLDNTKIPSNNLTEVPVTKTWSDGTKVSHPDVTMCLYADYTGTGKHYEDTGRRITIGASTGWKGTFDGLLKKSPYASGSPTVLYSVAEEEVDGYVSSVDVDYIDLPSTTTTWSSIGTVSDTQNLSTSEVYRFTYSGKALSVDDSGNICTKTADSEDTAQQWKIARAATYSGGPVLLESVKLPGHYLAQQYVWTQQYGTTIIFTTVTTADDNTSIMLNGNRIYGWGTQVLYSGGQFISTNQYGQSSGSGTVLTIEKRQTVTSSSAGWEVSVTNEKIPTVRIDVTKVWEDGNSRHKGTDVTIKLFADGTNTGKTLTLNAANSWTGSFKNLNRYQDDGKTEIRYTLIENKVQGYQTRITCTNTSYSGTDCTCQYQVINRPSVPEMPATGGRGTKFLYTFGVLIITGAGVTAFIRMRRKRGRRGVD